MDEPRSPIRLASPVRRPTTLDITHPLANKGVVLSDLAKLLAVPLEEIAIIGDAGNDIAMFERSGRIAMGNASPEVRRTSDVVPDNNGEDVFANAIERFILGGDRSNAQGGRVPRMVEPARAASKDSTLVTAEKELTSHAGAAVKALQAAGTDSAITSGRPLRAKAMLIDSLAHGADIVVADLLEISLEEQWARP